MATKGERLEALAAKVAAREFVHVREPLVMVTVRMSKRSRELLNFMAKTADLSLNALCMRLLFAERDKYEAEQKAGTPAQGIGDYSQPNPYL